MWYDMAPNSKTVPVCQFTLPNSANLSAGPGRASRISPCGRFSQLPSTPGWCWCHPILWRQLHGKHGSHLKFYWDSNESNGGIMGSCPDHGIMADSAAMPIVYDMGLAENSGILTGTSLKWSAMAMWMPEFVCVCVCGSNLLVSTQTIHIKNSK